MGKKKRITTVALCLLAAAVILAVAMLGAVRIVRNVQRRAEAEAMPYAGELLKIYDEFVREEFYCTELISPITGGTEYGEGNALPEELCRFSYWDGETRKGIDVNVDLEKDPPAVWEACYAEETEDERQETFYADGEWITRDQWGSRFNRRLEGYEKMPGEYAFGASAFVRPDPMFLESIEKSDSDAGGEAGYRYRVIFNDEYNKAQRRFKVRIIGAEDDTRDETVTVDYYTDSADRLIRCDYTEKGEKKGSGEPYEVRASNRILSTDREFVRGEMKKQLKEPFVPQDKR